MKSSDRHMKISWSHSEGHRGSRPVVRSWRSAIRDELAKLIRGETEVAEFVYIVDRLAC